MEHTETIKKIKGMVGDFLSEIAEAKRIDGSNVAVVKEAVSAYQKLCDLCEDGEAYGAGMRYSARRRDSRGRYMDGRPMNRNYGWDGGYYPYYDAPPDRADLAGELEFMAESGGNEAMKTALREAAKWLRQN